MKRPKVCFAVRDGLAGLYTNKTLYDFLVTRTDFPVDIGFCKTHYREVEPIFERLFPLAKIHDPAIHDRVKDKTRLILTGYSDIAGQTPFGRFVAVDMAVLKSCAPPITKEKRAQLKRTYHVEEERPILVVGFPGLATGISGQSPVLDELVENLSNDAQIYFVGTLYSGSEHYSRLGVKVIDCIGILKDYYAMADLAFIKNNLGPFEAHMHNFVEATEGGPLFVVPGITTQYGYKQLVERRVIREARDLQDLIAQAKVYLRNPKREEVRQARAEHIRETREVYLTDLLRFFKKILGLSEEPPTSDLMAQTIFIDNERGITEPFARVFHPETQWTHVTEDGSKRITEVSQRFYDCFRDKEVATS